MPEFYVVNSIDRAVLVATVDSSMVVLVWVVVCLGIGVAFGAFESTTSRNRS